MGALERAAERWGAAGVDDRLVIVLDDDVDPDLDDDYYAPHATSTIFVTTAASWPTHSLIDPKGSA